MRLYEQKRKYPQIGTPQDDTLLIEPERVPKRPRLDTSSNVVKISRKLRDGVELASAMTPVLVPEITVPLINPLREAASIQLEVDRMCEERRKSGWENGLDVRDFMCH
ncbi:hypothetical protein DL93DRAFT_2085277 [Clavulina sp. PMI_390]|nr:hypothetical protein DL93DRAFT_2085277 [Clavulina sp. PMI_390]